MSLWRAFPVALLAAWIASAQSSVFTPGNLVVSRSVYVGDASTVAAGQFLPPVCPATAACGPIKATDSGAFPVAGSTNNVWNNTKADGNFGVLSPIFLDQITPAGSPVSTFAIPATSLVTSFSSKSELAVNLSPDGTALTLVGYIAPVNTLDGSNSNTPGVYDPTNPAGGTYFRGVAQIGANGAIRVTPIRAYSGGTGRAAIFANGVYYLAGNANNGTGTPASIIATTGVEGVVPGQSPAANPVMIGNFSITQVIDPSTGRPYAADKAGKDSNYRGLTIFNNTLYVTKGSGSNGINTVYQVGNAGALPSLANAATTPITILPGFPVTLARAAGASNPFGIWFANATTLYVADEGDGTAANAITSPFAGLQKWSLINGVWKLDYVLQNGLALGQAYPIANYPASLYPATDGIRNITGRVNDDGTATIWAVTSTISSNGDTGADPNRLVMIRDVLANTSLSAAANEMFVTVRTANPGEVLRGVAFAPTAGATPFSNAPLILSSANPGAMAIAPGSLAFAFGQDLSIDSPGQILSVLPPKFAGTSVAIQDSSGQTLTAPLLFVSPQQVTFLVPPGLASGSATVTVTSPLGTQTASNVPIAATAPGLFVLNNAGLPAGYAVRVSSSGQQTVEQIYSFDANGGVHANAIHAPASGDRVYLVLFGTGFGAATAGTVQLSVGGVTVTPTYVGPQGSYTGLDQLNFLLPGSLSGSVNVQFSAAGVAANGVQILVQ